MFLCKKNWCDELLNASDFSDSLSTHAFRGKDWEILNGNFPHFLEYYLLEKKKKKSGSGAGGGEFYDETDVYQMKMPNKRKEATVRRKDWKWSFLNF